MGDSLDINTIRDLPKQRICPLLLPQVGKLGPREHRGPFPGHTELARIRTESGAPASWVAVFSASSGDLSGLSPEPALDVIVKDADLGREQGTKMKAQDATRKSV